MSTLSIARRRSVMPAVLASVLIGTLPLISACADGQKAPTRQEYAVTDGVQAHAGNVVLRNVLLTADVGDTEGGASTLALQGVVANNTGTDDRLVGISAANTATTALPFALVTSSATTSAAASAAASSTPAATTTVGINTPLVLGTGGLQLQVSGFKTPVLPGSLVSLTFSFAQAGNVTVSVPVYSLGSRSPGVEPSTKVSFPAPDVPGIYNQQEYDNQAAPSS